MTIIRPAAIAVALILATPAFAEPWGTYDYPYDEGEHVYGAYQGDTTGAYELSYDCADVLQDATIGIRTPEAWDATASYASEVEAEFTIDGRPVPAPVFSFENWDEQLAVVTDDWIESETFEALVKAMSGARQSIDVRFFDKAMSFEATGVPGAIAYARANCGL